MNKHGFLWKVLLIGSVAAGVSVAPAAARACGGFFCSTQPVDQSAEQIVFSLEPDKVTAYIQIAYTGPATDFSWVLPVSSVPVISVGSQAVFQNLNGRTAPQFNIDYQMTGGQCGQVLFEAADGAGPPRAGNDPGVTVLAMGQVGPFDYVVLQSKDAGELTKYLADNGFTQPPEAKDLIAYYLDQGMLFVAVKLKKDATAGEIQPLVLEMKNPEACIPLILTRIAAVPDMPVIAYVLGSSRAFPKNWFHVEPDLSKVNWFTGGDNYRMVATEAINEAAGHGFITEYAGDSSIMKDTLDRPGMYDLPKLQAITDAALFVQDLLRQGFPRDATMQGLLRKHIPMPPALAARGVSEQQFYNDLDSFRADLVAAGFVFNAAAFVADLQDRIITPLVKAQAMFDSQPYLTRLFSTVSPDEMTRDPLFLLNADLPMVSNVHTAKAYGQCAADGTIANMTLTIEGGETLVFMDPVRPYGGQAWPYAQRVPAAKRISLVGPTGPPVYVTRAQVLALDSMLNVMAPAEVRGRIVPVPGAEISSDPSTIRPEQTLGGGGSLCAVGRGGNGDIAWLALALLAIVRLARRKRR